MDPYGMQMPASSSCGKKLEQKSKPFWELKEEMAARPHEIDETAQGGDGSSKVGAVAQDALEDALEATRVAQLAEVTAEIEKSGVLDGLPSVERQSIIQKLQAEMDEADDDDNEFLDELKMQLQAKHKLKVEDLAPPACKEGGNQWQSLKVEDLAPSSAPPSAPPVSQKSTRRFSVVVPAKLQAGATMKTLLDGRVIRLIVPRTLRADRMIVVDETGQVIGNASSASAAPTAPTTPAAPAAPAAPTAVRAAARAATGYTPESPATRRKQMRAPGAARHSQMRWLEKRLEQVELEVWKDALLDNPESFDALLEEAYGEQLGWSEMSGTDMSDTEGIQSGGTSQRRRRRLDDLDGSDSEAELEAMLAAAMLRKHGGGIARSRPSPTGLRGPGARI